MYTNLTIHYGKQEKTIGYSSQDVAKAWEGDEVTLVE